MSGDQFEANIDRALFEAQGSAKPWWQSKTIWVNVIALAFAMAEANLQLLSGHLPGGIYAWTAYGLPIINMVLRMITKVGVRL
jgi:hypothetical protein